MADVTINGLGVLAAPDAADEIGVWDVTAGQYLKSTRTQLVGAIITGAGTIATAGYTLTVPATGTAALISSSTWTPTLIGDSTAGANSYTTQFGRYTKIGTLVMARCYVKINAASGMTGNMLLGGLPFAAKSGSGFCAITVSFWVGLAANFVFLSGYITDGFLTAKLQGVKTAAAATADIGCGDFGNGAGIMATLVYETA